MPQIIPVVVWWNQRMMPNAGSEKYSNKDQKVPRNWDFLLHKTLYQCAVGSKIAHSTTKRFVEYPLSLSLLGLYTRRRSRPHSQNVLINGLITSTQLVDLWDKTPMVTDTASWIRPPKLYCPQRTKAIRETKILYTYKTKVLQTHTDTSFSTTLNITPQAKLTTCANG
jgi:hypothetical protein